MTTIKIAFEKATTENIAKVQALLDREALHNPNWSGADFEIVADDFTSVDTGDEYAGTILLGQINRILGGEDEDDA